MSEKRSEPLTPEEVDLIAEEYEVDGEIHSAGAQLLADWWTLRAALKGLQNPEGCWCEPERERFATAPHDPECIAARKALGKTKP